MSFVAGGVSGWHGPCQMRHGPNASRGEIRSQVRSPETARLRCRPVNGMNKIMYSIRFNRAPRRDCGALGQRLSGPYRTRQVAYFFVYVFLFGKTGFHSFLINSKVRQSGGSVDSFGVSLASSVTGYARKPILRRDTLPATEHPIASRRNTNVDFHLRS
jgi:hypothetical protein